MTRVADLIVKEGDTAPWVQVDPLAENGSIQDLTGATARFVFCVADAVRTVRFNRLAEIVTPGPTNFLRYKWLVGDLVRGFYVSEFEVEFGDGSRATYPGGREYVVLVRADLGGNA